MGSVVLYAVLLTEQIRIVKILSILLFKELELKAALAFINFLVGLLKKIVRVYFPQIIALKLADTNVIFFFLKYFLI